jgi:hypothetical protein
MDKSDILIAGQRSEITEDQFVQSSQQGAAVVSTRSGGGIILPMVATTIALILFAVVIDLIWSTSNF